MRWDGVAPDGCAAELRAVLLAAIRQAYDENCRRFAPEDVGDNNISFSHTVRENLRYLLQRGIEDDPALLGRVAVFWKGLIYELRMPGGVRMHIYKAPPGISDVRKLRFNGSDRQLEILKVNADQLALDLEAAMDGSPGEETSEPCRHIVAVHFGDPLDGLEKVVVGEPFLSDLEAPDWLWVESLSEGTVLYEREPLHEAAIPSDAMEDDDFDDLKMREHPQGSADARSEES